MQAPIIHRSLVFTTIKDESDENAAKGLEDIFTAADTNRVEVANRPLEGKTAVRAAREQNKPKCIEVLFRNGARDAQDDFLFGVNHNFLDGFPASILTNDSLSDNQKEDAVQISNNFHYEDNISQSAQLQIEEWNQVHTEAQIEIRQRGLGKDKVKARISDG